MFAHRGVIVSEIEGGDDADLKDLLCEELALVDEVLAAPTRPFTKNYQESKPTEKY